MADVLIKNGTVVTPDEAVRSDVMVSGELISAIAPHIDAASGCEVIDASGMIVFPGGVDAHTHVNLTVGRSHVSDGWLEGTRAAAFGGTTTVVEHPGFGPEGCPLSHQLEIYRREAGEAVVDYGIHGVFQHWDSDIEAELPGVVAGGYPSFKAYMTYDGRLDEMALLRAMRALKEAGGLMTVHAENHAIVSYLADKYKRQAPASVLSHPLSRPGYAEALAIETAIALAEAAGGAPLYIVHLSTAEGLEAIRRARASGKKVWAETCPQYLLLTDECYEGNFEDALRYVMAPPLRKQGDVEALWEGLFDGSISTVGTDHCSFAWNDKKEKARGSVFNCPGGIPGVETRLALLYSEGVLKRGLSLTRFTDLVSGNPARLFGLSRKGAIAVGCDADLLVFDPQVEQKISVRQLHQTVDYTPYESMIVRGWPHKVLLRGNIIISDGCFTGRQGQGKFIARQASMS